MKEATLQDIFNKIVGDERPRGDNEPRLLLKAATSKEVKHQRAAKAIGDIITGKSKWK